MELVATVTEPVSGRILKAYTTEPGMQFYIPSSNMDYLNGHGNRKYGKYYGFCLEMQHFPDSPNKPQFPSTVLRPGEIYRQTTIYKFENSPATKCHLRIKSVPPPYWVRIYEYGDTTEKIRRWYGDTTEEVRTWYGDTSMVFQQSILHIISLLNKGTPPSIGLCGAHFTQKHSKVNNISMQKA